MNIEVACKNCKFSQPLSDDMAKILKGDSLEVSCRRFPQGVYTAADDWCGEFVADVSKIVEGMK